MPDTQDSFAVVKEKVRRMESDLMDLKGDVRQLGTEIDELDKSNDTTAYKLEQIYKQLEQIQTTLNKDTGWRGFFIDVVKALAQIAALVGAGKFIF